MKKMSFAVKVSPGLRNRVKSYCEERGLKQGAFVEMALREKLEEEEDREDIYDLKRLRTEEGMAIPLEAYMALRRHRV